MGSGIAKGAAARGKLVAFGDGHRVRWHSNAQIIYRGNPNVLAPGRERAVSPSVIEWVQHYPGKRLYHAGQVGGRWRYNPAFKATPGELYFDQHELLFAQSLPRGFVVVEPFVKPIAPNKQWPVERYQQVVRELKARGLTVVQFDYGFGKLLDGVTAIRTNDFRRACAALTKAALFIGPEGGGHHAAAAAGIPAVVIFGGMMSTNTGYDFHVNLAAAGEPCGTQTTVCEHCRQAMLSITTEQVVEAALGELRLT